MIEFTPSQVYDLCRKAEKPSKYFKASQYIGINSKCKDSFGGWQKQLSCTAWQAASVQNPRCKAVDYDTVLPFSHELWQAIITAVRAEAEANNRDVRDHGELDYQLSYMQCPRWVRQAVAESNRAMLHDALDAIYDEVEA